MTEVLGQRSLMGVGVVLLWLLLFHLLVNIWLLCVFTSLLLVLGGWLSSQALLESHSLVHLERFIHLEQVPSSPEDEELLDEEILRTVRKIIRDFVASWFSTVSSESEFQSQVHHAMVAMAMEMKTRAKHVDRTDLTQRVLVLLGCHLQDFLRAQDQLTLQEQQSVGGGSGESEGLWREYSRVTTPHLATTHPALELDYTRALVDLLLYVLVPAPHLESRTGRFVVGELITCNVFLPLVAKLSDPDWLNVLLVQIFNRSTRPREPVLAEPSLPSPQLPPPLPAESKLVLPLDASEVLHPDAPPPPETEPVPEPEIPELAPCDVFDIDEVDGPQNHAGEEESAGPLLERYLRERKFNPFYQENDSDLESPLVDSKQNSPDYMVLVGPEEEGLYETRKECSNNSLDSVDVCPCPVDGPNILVSSEHPNGYRPAGGALGDSSILDGPTKELSLGVDLTGLGTPDELTAGSPLQVSSPMPSFSFEPLSSPDGPVLIQNLRITGTITAKEHRGTGSHPYTLYTIKYETAMGCETPAVGVVQLGPEDLEGALTGCENLSRIHPVAYHLVNRRYSEFLNLQTRLEERTDLRKLIKGVKGPKKIFPDMPFGNMDTEKIEARKGLLETFLKHLCAIAEIANSEEMQEFLALNTDARIAFVKKPFIVSRIDKIVVNAIVDTLKTAFPRSELQSPTEDNDEPDGLKLKSRSRLKFSSKNIPSMNGSDLRPSVLFSLEQTTPVLNRKSLEDLQMFIGEQEVLSAVSCDSERAESPADGAVRAEQGRGRGSEGSEVALNILCLLMKEQWSWLCSENIQRMVRLLFGTFINRWLDVGVANLTSCSYWVTYLQVIQEAVWPGGALPASPQPRRSQQQKDSSREEALDALARLLPDLVSDLLGSDKYRLCWKTVLDSLQNPHINRHLVYTLLDLLLDVLVPELAEDHFQRRLLQTLSKNPEKLLA